MHFNVPNVAHHTQSATYEPITNAASEIKNTRLIDKPVVAGVCVSVLHEVVIVKPPYHVWIHAKFYDQTSAHPVMEPYVLAVFL